MLMLMMLMLNMAAMTMKIILRDIGDVDEDEYVQSRKLRGIDHMA